MMSKINLPLNKQGQSQEIEFKKLVIIGANGAGKTRFGSEIEKNNLKVTHRISAQKSLMLPDHVNTTSKEVASAEFLYGYYTAGKESYDWLTTSAKLNSRWNNKQNTNLLNDYDKLMILLHTEEAEESINYKNNGGIRPITKLDKIKKVWEQVLPHRELKISSGKMEAMLRGGEDRLYNASEMSDGERVIFYLAGSILAVPENSIIIIDEPEMHIHPSLIKNFFDLIEIERTDCSFIYLTHNIDFAFSRQDAQKIWIKEFDGSKWDYEILQNESEIPEQVYYEILGSRKPVVFIEGDKSSLDYQIYQQVFSDKTVYPIDNCHKVIQTVKSFEENKFFHNIQANGIIDRDRRSSQTINDLIQRGIWVLNVAEVENLFLLEEVVKELAKHLGKNDNEILTQTKNNIQEYFRQELNNQVIIHFKNEFDSQLKKLVEINFANKENLDSAIDIGYRAINKLAIFERIESDFRTLLNSCNYLGILQVFNQKGMIGNSRIHTLLGMSKPEDYKKLVLHLLKNNNQPIKNAINNQIIKEKMIEHEK